MDWVIQAEPWSNVWAYQRQTAVKTDLTTTLPPYSLTKKTARYKIWQLKSVHACCKQTAKLYFETKIQVWVSWPWPLKGQKAGCEHCQITLPETILGCIYRWCSQFSLLIYSHSFTKKKKHLKVLFALHRLHCWFADISMSHRQVHLAKCSRFVLPVWDHAGRWCYWKN